MSGMQWYAVNAKPRQERLVELSLARLGIETFCPRFRRTKLIRRRWSSVTGPLFPGYLFAQFDLDACYRAVNFAQGVRKLVNFGRKPVVVSEEIIRSIRDRMEDGCMKLERPPLKPGQSVRIQGGPFRGLEAIFEHAMSDEQRVVLLLRTLAFQARVVVSLDDVIAV